MNLKEARETIRKSRTPGEVFYCDDVRKFDLQLEIEKSHCFLEGYEAGVREAANLTLSPYITITDKNGCHPFSEDILKLLDKGKGNERRT